MTYKGVYPVQAVFAQDATLTGEINEEGILSGILMPDDWTAGTLGFQALALNPTTSVEKAYSVYDDEGNQIAYTVGADRYVAVPPEHGFALNRFKLECSVAQAAERTLVLFFRDTK